VPKLSDAIRFARSVRPHHAETFARTVVPQVVRPARVIWNQAIGAIFLVLALPAIIKALQVIRSGEWDQQSTFAVILSAIFASVMIFFGIGSLLKARRIENRR
jgi:uncharacterized membrane protein YcjF (UPF0283 family)